MSFELQCVDANCSDCKYMIRDLEKRKASLELHDKWQKEEYDKEVKRVEALIEKYKKENHQLALHQLQLERKRMKYQFDTSKATIHYGYCNHKQCDLSFIPNTCQIETQDCFVHRKIQI